MRHISWKELTNVTVQSCSFFSLSSQKIFILTGTHFFFGFFQPSVLLLRSFDLGGGSIFGSGGIERKEEEKERVAGEEEERKKGETFAWLVYYSTY